ncbi:uncharacterized protein LOC105172311 [Sesamum indicum]|uniref:Uncharacterized protein LOC105172311 n=1 Tax=Sesamum indicum TaxID=4182 RepID=A0A6I9U373_SESIN|nr:uncharacterized protein LOC105172311 [Sesamum indicum]
MPIPLPCPPVSNNDNDEVDVSYPTMDTSNPLSSGPEKIPTTTRKGGQSDRLKRIDKCIDAITACSEAKTWKLANIFNDNIEDCMAALSKMEGLPRDLFFAAQDQFVLKDCVGAIDGTLIAASVPVSMQNAYRSRHGDISQNVMDVCDFNLMFTYVMAGWEGSANDARKYYIVDSAYPNFPGFLASHRQDHYHINSFRGNNRQAHSPKELFNQRHSQLHNVIERAFGVLKNIFLILKGPMPPYSLDRQ